MNICMVMTVSHLTLGTVDVTWHDIGTICVDGSVEDSIWCIMVAVMYWSNTRFNVVHVFLHIYGQEVFFRQWWVLEQFASSRRNM